MRRRRKRKLSRRYGHARRYGHSASGASGAETGMPIRVHGTLFVTPELDERIEDTIAMVIEEQIPEIVEEVVEEAIPETLDELGLSVPLEQVEVIP